MRDVEAGEQAELLLPHGPLPVRVLVDEANSEGEVLTRHPAVPVGRGMVLRRADGRQALVVVVNDHGRFLMSGPFH